MNCTANYTAEVPATATAARIPPRFIDYTCRINLGEECDAGNINGTPIDNSVCSSTCTLKAVPPVGWTNPGANPLTIEFSPANTANGRGIAPVSQFKWIVGDGIAVFDAGDQFLLSSPFPTLLQGGETKILNNSLLLNGAPLTRTFGVGLPCVGNGTIDLGPGGIKTCTNNVPLFTAGANGTINGVRYTGNTSNIPASMSADDVNKPTSVGSAVLRNDFAVSVGYMNEPIFVRVSKPAISNTAGGNAYVAQPV